MRQLTAFVTLALLISERAWAQAQKIPIESDKPLRGTLSTGQANCYQFSLDAAATREVVYWPQAKIYVRLEPCTGLPHLRVSVHGCPSDGNVVNWEYQSDRARNDLRASGQPVPAQWEWIGDVETLSIDVTHRNFYIEVSNYHWPLRTNSSMAELSRRLRDADLSAQADEVDDIMFIGVIGEAEVARLKAFQALLLPPASFELGVYLHDDVSFPEEQILPLKRTAGWDRNILKEEGSVLVVGQPDDPYSGNYLITFWPPTRQPNTTAGNATSASPNASSSAAARRSSRHNTDAPSAEEEEAEEAALLAASIAPHHARRLLDMRRSGAAVTWGDVEGMLGPEHAAEIEAASRLLAPTDIIFHPDPRYAKQEETEPAPERRALSPEEEAARVEKMKAERARVQARMQDFKGLAGFDAAVAAGAARLAEYKQHSTARRSGPIVAQAERRALSGSLSVNGSVGNYSMVQRRAHPLSDDDLQYMIYWLDLTAAVKARWGLMTDSLGHEYTRLLDEPCDPDRLRCGIKQVIRQQEFSRIDVDQDGTLVKAEFDAAYSHLPSSEAPFVNGSSFADLAGTSGGITEAQFVTAWNGADAVLDASIKDPLMRTHWTVCGLTQAGVPVVPSGNVSLDSRRAEWLSIRSFDQLSDGRLARSLKGLDDSDNNVYAINVIVRNVVTGEHAVYKPHILQRRTPIYQAPEADGPVQMTIIIVASCTIGGIVLLFLVAIWITRRRKTKPRIRIKKSQD